MHKTKSQKKNERRKAKKEARRITMLLLSNLMIYIRILIDFIIDFIFGLFYKDKEVCIPPVSKSFLTESAVSIASKIRNGTLTSEEIVRAYIERAKEVNDRINAFTDNRFEDAIGEAKKIDQDLSQKKYTDADFEKKPFLGVPFTTKESTACAGLSFTFGLVCRKGTKAIEDADVVAQMKAAGGILIANTNVPEINLWQETRNMLFGQTLNPYNTTRTVGGSSGGEAALIAACGSACGLGTDIGGSIRMPAYFCGIFGHKPTSKLISTKGLTRRTGLEDHTMVVAGPMSRHAEDLLPMLKVLVGPNLSKLKLGFPVDIHTLNYCYIEESKDARASSMCSDLKQLMLRVVNHFDEELKDQKVKRLEIDELRFSHRLWRYWMTQENSNFAHELTNCKGVVNVFTEMPKKLCGMSSYTLAALLKLADDQLPRENDVWARDTTRLLREKLLNEISNNGVLFYPSYTWPASYHYTALLRPFNFSYTSIFNVLMFPVTQVPLGLSQNGLPVGIQVVAAPYNDHLCLAVAKYLEKVFGGYVPPF